MGELYPAILYESEGDTLLINSYAHSVDAKGRIFIPSKWRLDLGDTVIVTRGITGREEQRCLFGMSLAVWNEFLERFSKVAVTDVAAQKAMRVTFANANDCELDKQGRIILPASLREYAGIKGDAQLVGMGRRIEIWSKDNWTLFEQGEELTDDMLSHLTGLGI